MKALAALALLVPAALFVQDAPEMPPPARPAEQHTWLHRLVGTWDCVAEATMGPDAEPMTMESTLSVRSIGGLWIVGEGSATFAGEPFTSILTLGWDPDQDAFVGTWIDSMQPHLWSYRGALDEAGKVLALDTEGPGFGDPTVPAKFRETIEPVDADHWRFTSSMEGEDGQWETFLRAEYRRKE